MRGFLAQVLLLAVTTAIVGTLLFQVGRTPKSGQVRAAFASPDHIILDRNGLVLDEVRVDKRSHRLNWVSPAQVPASLTAALVEAEDRRFYWHPGVDPLARFRPTLTMQLADLLDGSGGGRKSRQMLAAVGIEMSWNKRQILEAYMNLVSYRGEFKGIAAASFGLFDKPPSALTRTEAAVLVAMIHSPPAQVRGRACRLLAMLGTPEECGLLSVDHLVRPSLRMAPHVAERLRWLPEMSGHGILRSTLDRRIQWQALSALQQQRSLSAGAVVVIENATGDVLAYVGNLGSRSRGAAFDAAVAEHQAGSTLAPFVYAKALDERILTASTRLPNSPLPKSDLVSVREALTSNLSLPTLAALELVGNDAFIQTMSALGFSGLRQPEEYGPSLALGSANVRLVELTNAYRTLANGGVWTQAKFSPQQLSDVGSKRVLSAAATYIVTDLLSGHPALGLSPRLWAALKTGGSADSLASWAIGFSDRYTVGVWTGNNAMAATSVWRVVMNFLHGQGTSAPPEVPAGLVSSQAERKEWYMVGTEPVESPAEAATGMRSRISYPPDRATILPSAHQRLLIQVIAPRSNQNLYLNGRRLGRARQFLRWEAEAGKYRLELRDSKGQVVDKVRFEVRGGGFALK